ncbi:global transcription factor [Cucumis melo var. makuwa]|uniref:Global transcription factor n=1 Tax=Cucumis melo var. makuwa TaxID=1194695 RepID=A0A5D3CHI5_CUCMM|nr:global transcription factor [Cucumis melo var. makuwa]TYK10995.1 global transcription factor [Cucumis melo var. makuwa]
MSGKDLPTQSSTSGQTSLPTCLSRRKPRRRESLVCFSDAMYCVGKASPDRLYRAALLRNQFVDTILKAREKHLKRGSPDAVSSASGKGLGFPDALLTASRKPKPWEHPLFPTHGQTFQQSSPKQQGNPITKVKRTKNSLGGSNGLLKKGLDSVGGRKWLADAGATRVRIDSAIGEAARTRAHGWDRTRSDWCVRLKDEGRKVTECDGELRWTASETRRWLDDDGYLVDDAGEQRQTLVTELNGNDRRTQRSNKC